MKNAPPAVAALAAALLAGCLHFAPSPKEKAAAENHYYLGVEALRAGDPQGSLRELQEALKLNPDFAEAHEELGLLLHLGYKHYDEAEKELRRAIELHPSLPETMTMATAWTNLGNLYLDQGKYDEAIAAYDHALGDMLYREPYLAQGNRGWALFKKGKVEEGISSIKEAVTTNPKFCLGYRNLGQIYGEQGKAEESCRSYARYREACPDVGDAYFREGVCAAKLGKTDEAKTAFATCETKAAGALKDDCHRLLEQLQ